MNVQRLGAWLLALALAALPGSAQEQSGALEGTITDATGAVVPGATVEARNAAGLAQDAVSDQDGHYNFPALPGGNYTVTGSLTGFTSVKVTDVRLGVGQTLKVDLTLRVSTVEEVVTVTGEAPVVDVT